MRLTTRSRISYRIAWAYIGQVETGMRNISLNNLRRLAIALDVDLGELTEGLQEFEGQP